MIIILLCKDINNYHYYVMLYSDSLKITLNLTFNRLKGVEEGRRRVIVTLCRVLSWGLQFNEVI